MIYSSEVSEVSEVSKMCSLSRKKNVFSIEVMKEISEYITNQADRFGGTEELLKYVEKVYKFLHDLKPGIYNVEKFVVKDNEELFTSIIKLYILEIGNVSFLNEEWKEFRKM